MSENKKVYVGEPIRSQESNDLISQLRTLLARHNTLCSVEKAIRDSDEIAELYNQVLKEMEESGNSSFAVLLALTIEAANAKIHDLQDDSDNDVELREKVRRLERENNELKLRLSTIAELLDNGKR